MNIDEMREMCLSIHPAVAEGTPFAGLGCEDVAFTIGGKIFAFLCIPTDSHSRHHQTEMLVVLKCDPDMAIALRERYADIVEPARHWNKRYWNQVHYDRLSTDEMKKMVQHSFELVFAKLTKKVRTSLGSSF